MGEIHFPFIAMKDEQIIERLAEFMKDEWKSTAKAMAAHCYGGDWNLWRKLEEKVMEDPHVYIPFFEDTVFEGNNHMEALLYYGQADLPTRCKALIQVLDNE